MAAANDAMYPLEKHKPALGSLRQPQIAEAREFCFSKGYIAPRKGWGAFQYRVGTAVSAGQPSQPPCTLSPSPLLLYKQMVLNKSNQPLEKLPLKEVPTLCFCPHDWPTYANLTRMGECQRTNNVMGKSWPSPRKRYVCGRSQ